MPYDFDKPVNRRDTHSMKWDVKEHELPMWVADMDFQTAPEIQAAIQERAAHGVFGYSVVPEEWYQAYMGWWERRLVINCAGHCISLDVVWHIYNISLSHQHTY